MQVFNHGKFILFAKSIKSAGNATGYHRLENLRTIEKRQRIR